MNAKDMRAQEVAMQVIRLTDNALTLANKSNLVDTIPTRGNAGQWANAENARLEAVYTHDFGSRVFAQNYLSPAVNTSQLMSDAYNAELEAALTCDRIMELANIRSELIEGRLLGTQILTAKEAAKLTI